MWYFLLFLFGLLLGLITGAALAYYYRVKLAAFVARIECKYAKVQALYTSVKTQFLSILHFFQGK